MTGTSDLLRNVSLTSGACLLLLGIACSVGPRTPIEEAPSPYTTQARQDADARSKAARKEDEEFRLPQAERVVDDKAPAAETSPQIDSAAPAPEEVKASPTEAAADTAAPESPPSETAPVGK